MSLVSRAVSDMIAFYGKESTVPVHDISHFLKVWGYAKTIGEEEGLDPKTQEILELSAIAHDIACPLCREKYGNTNGKAQEAEGGPLTEAFYKDYDLPEEELSRIVYIVSHHHTYTGVDGQDYQIMLEADFLVNADESKMTDEAISNFKEKVFRTKTGLTFLQELYGKKERA
ncbi:MAG: HD domain-containing protein [Lachnospiraceae bacterium]|jgi:uncharacterized protein